MCRDYSSAQIEEGGKLQTGLRGMLEGVNTVTIQDTGCSAIDLKEISSRDMVVYENITPASPATCRSSLV